MSTPPKSRYDTKEIAREVQRERTKAGLTVDAFGAQTGIGRWSVYKKEAGEVPYSVEELGVIAELFGAPIGWPFIPWQSGQMIDHQLMGKHPKGGR